MYRYDCISVKENPGDRSPRFKYFPAETVPPAVSIVSPYYNTGEIFLKTVRSVLRQSLQAFEFLIVDDGSDAENKAFLQHIAAEDPRIRIIEQPENRGLSAARNTGARAAATDFILLVDSDDLLEVTCAEKLRWMLEARPDMFLANGLTAEMSPDCVYVNPLGFSSLERFLTRNPISTQGVMIRKEVFSLCQYDEERRQGLEDWDFWLNRAQAGFYGETMPEVGAWYRRRPNSAQRWAHWDDAYINTTFIPLMREKYPSLWEKGFPAAHPPVFPFGAIPSAVPFKNPLAKNGPRHLYIVDGQEDAPELPERIARHRDKAEEVSLLLLGKISQEHKAALFALTEDIFHLPVFLPFWQAPAFARYYVQSRQPDLAMLEGTGALRLAPFLRVCFPDLTLCCQDPQTVPIAIRPFLGYKTKDNGASATAKGSFAAANLIPLLALFAVEPRLANV